MAKKVKEVYVGVLPGKDGEGEPATRTLMFAGPNPFIEKGIYDENHPPQGWTWPKFLEKAIRHDRHGVVVVYEGEPQANMKAVLKGKKETPPEVSK